MGKNKGKPVTIHMKTTIHDQGRTEKTTLSAMGQLFFKGSSTYITFDESTDGESTDQVTKQTLRFQHDRLTVIRQGSVNMNQQFVVGQETEGMLRSPFALMAMRTHTRECKFQWDKENGKGFATVRYTLHLQNEHAGEYHLHYTIEEVIE